MPVGGVKEKVLAAKRAGIDTVVLPRLNEKDLEDIPEQVRREMSFVFVDTIDEVLERALEAAREPKAGDERLPRAARV
jgi:ATP-dependent Lon protease